MFNLSLNSYPEVLEYVKSNFSNLNINYFSLARLYRDGRHYSLTSDPRWAIEHLVKNKLPPAGLMNFDEIQGKQLTFANENYDRSLGWDEGIFLYGKERFNIKNPLTIMIKRNDCLDQYMLDIHRNDAVDIYLNQLHQVEVFFKALKYQFRDLIDAMDNQPFIPDSKFIEIRDNNQSITNPSKKEFFLYYNDNKIAKLSAQENACLQRLAKGTRIKDIAEELNISPRTVETHLNKIKNKIMISKTKDLITCYWNNREFS